MCLSTYSDFYQCTTLLFNVQNAQLSVSQKLSGNQDHICVKRPNLKKCIHRIDYYRVHHVCVFATLSLHFDLLVLCQ